MKYIAFCAMMIALTGCGGDQTVPDPAAVQTYMAQGISVRSYDYKTFSEFLNRDNDTTYVINFWATWCKPCIEELPHFERLNEEMKGEKVRVLLVSLDMKKEVERALIPFIKKKQLRSDVILLSDPDANTWIPAIDSAWSGAIPATLIYKGGKRRFFEKSFTYESLITEIYQSK